MEIWLDEDGHFRQFLASYLQIYRFIAGGFPEQLQSSTYHWTSWKLSALLKGTLTNSKSW